MKKLFFCVALSLGMAANAHADLITYTFTDNTGADFSSFTDGSGPFVINDIAANVGGVDFTFDLTLSGNLGVGAAGIDFSSQRVVLNGGMFGFSTKSVVTTISDIQGDVTFNGFVSVDRFDDAGGDNWDVNGNAISATGNTVALSSPILGAMTITATSDLENLDSRYEGFQVDFTAVPEPGSLLFLSGPVCLMALRRRRTGVRS